VARRRPRGAVVRVGYLKARCLHLQVVEYHHRVFRVWHAGLSPNLLSQQFRGRLAEPGQQGGDFRDRRRFEEIFGSLVPLGRLEADPLGAEAACAVQKLGEAT
jgi:hypothetical protein